MGIKITMKTRDGKAYATGDYSEKYTVVKAGGKVSEEFRGYGGVRQIRYNNQNVDAEGNILRDVVFKSPSTAAQFVNGNIANGLRVWKVNGMTLGEYINKND